MRKYDPLHIHLTDMKANEWQASFKDIEKVIGTKLPPSAYEYPAWWGNEFGNTSIPHKIAWHTAGWRTSNLNLTAKRITFIRDSSVRTVRTALKGVNWRAKLSRFWGDWRCKLVTLFV